ncbi:hypothetical protein BJ944DRAFT_101852 [Cunninghamella echinulata]|nr:hypothetical protein BJ944DRAFT_101852 [Cunninghamella echinulata]
MVKSLTKSFKDFTLSKSGLFKDIVSNKNGFFYSDANVAKGAFTGDAKAFTLTLVDVRKTVEENGIICTTKDLYEDKLEYIILSYRWGEVHEWVTPTSDYLAHIKSFGPEDIETLCRNIIKEPDLKYVDYLWVDTISIDQFNNEKKKETIYRMTEIYERSTYILAVPDLHHTYLQRSAMNQKAIRACTEYNRHIYTGFMAGIKGNESYENHFDLLNSRLVCNWIYRHLDPDMYDTFDPEKLLNDLLEMEHELVLEDTEVIKDKVDYNFNDESRMCFDFVTKALSDIINLRSFLIGWVKNLILI